MGREEKEEAILLGQEKNRGKLFWNICILGGTTKTLVEEQKSREAC